MMENNPIDTNSFRHFLIIRGVEYEIQEPNKFDQSNFKVIQDDIARDTYFGNEEAPMEFEISFGAPTSSFMDNDGVLINHLPSGAELLIQENKDFGNEADVKYKLTKNNVSFTIGNIDFNNDFNTDNSTYVYCRVIQNNNQSLIKKREDITIDLLATKDLDDNDITPIPIQRMFFKAKPTYGESVFECPNDYGVNLQAKGSDNPAGDTSTMFYFYNNCQAVIKYAVEDTLSFLDQTLVHNGNVGPDWENRNDEGGLFTLIRAKDDLSNIKLNIKGLVFQQQGDADNGGNGFAETYLVLRWGLDINTPTGGFNVLYNFIDENGNTTQSIDNATYDIPFLPSGHRIWFYFRTKVRQSATNIVGDPRMECFSRINKYTVSITATSTAISSVSNAVRWIDLIKQNYKAIGSLPVNASIYDVGGKHYDNFLFNKNLIKQDLTKPFYLKLKDTKEHLLEQCAYAQVNDNEIYIGQYKDFYNNIDMGGFIEVPEYDSVFYKNPKYLVNKFIFGYEKYEQDRNERNTVDAIHTDSEFFPQTQNSINTKSIKLPFVRDAFLLEYMRRDVFSIKDNESESDTIGIVDVIPLPPNSRNKFTRLLTWNADGVAGTTKILSDNTFSWTQLGFNVGDTIIESGVNRVVLALTPTLITLSFSGGVASGTDFLTFDYPLTNVFYTNRTNQGLVFAENLRNSDNFGNLRYSIKRNILENWREVLATYGKFILGKKIKNTYFKANGDCNTQFVGEPEPIKENADINISDISEFKILSQDMYKTSVKCEFEKAVQLLKDIQNVRGFVRVQTPIGSVIKGYLKEGNNFWSDGILNLELEVKNESDFLTLTYTNGKLTINEVGYAIKLTEQKIYNIFNDFIQFFDENNINLCNRTRYDKVSLNGVTFENIDDLVNALENL